jgi:hypothetical protein
MTATEGSRLVHALSNDVTLTISTGQAAAEVATPSNPLEWPFGDDIPDVTDLLRQLEGLLGDPGQRLDDVVDLFERPCSTNRRLGRESPRRSGHLKLSSLALTIVEHVVDRLPALRQTGAERQVLREVRPFQTLNIDSTRATHYEFRQSPSEGSAPDAKILVTGHLTSVRWAPRVSKRRHF